MADEIANWSIYQVSDCLRNMDLGCYVARFARERIDGEVLGWMDDLDLTILDIEEDHHSSILDLISKAKIENNYSKESSEESSKVHNSPLLKTNDYLPFFGTTPPQNVIHKKKKTKKSFMSFVFPKLPCAPPSPQISPSYWTEQDISLWLHDTDYVSNFSNQCIDGESFLDLTRIELIQCLNITCEDIDFFVAAIKTLNKIDHHMRLNPDADGMHLHTSTSRSLSDRTTSSERSNVHKLKKNLS